MDLLKIYLSATLLISFSFQQTRSIAPPVAEIVKVICCALPCEIFNYYAPCTSEQCCQYVVTPVIVGALVTAAQRDAHRHIKNLFPKAPDSQKME